MSILIRLIAGLRNTILGLAYLAVCAFLGYTAGAQQLPQMGNTFLMIGAGVGGIVVGRAFNKKWGGDPLGNDGQQPPTK